MWKGKNKSDKKNKFGKMLTTGKFWITNLKELFVLL